MATSTTQQVAVYGKLLRRFNIRIKLSANLSSVRICLLLVRVLCMAFRVIGPIVDCQPVAENLLLPPNILGDGSALISTFALLRRVIAPWLAPRPKRQHHQFTRPVLGGRVPRLNGAKKKPIIGKTGRPGSAPAASDIRDHARCDVCKGLLCFHQNFAPLK